MRERDEIGGRCGLHGSKAVMEQGGRCDDWEGGFVSKGWRDKIEVPQSGGGCPLASHDELRMECDPNAGGGKDNCAARVAELAHGEERRRGEGRNDVYATGGER